LKPEILATKLNIPLRRPDLVPRPHLIERVNEGLTRKLTLISAPAGFGKTTLVSMWAAQASMPVAWLSLEEQENDLTRFLAYIITAIQGVDPEIGKDAQAILQTPQLPSYETILTSIINDLEVSDQDIALVLDDYHLIHTRGVHEAVVFLVEHLPSQTHVVIITRADPPLPIPRLRGRRELTELRAADLRFTLAEASDFLEKIAPLRRRCRRSTKPHRRLGCRPANDRTLHARTGRYPQLHCFLHWEPPIYRRLSDRGGT